MQTDYIHQMVVGILNGPFHGRIVDLGELADLVGVSADDLKPELDYLVKTNKIERNGVNYYRRICNKI